MRAEPEPEPEERGRTRRTRATAGPTDKGKGKRCVTPGATILPPLHIYSYISSASAGDHQLLPSPRGTGSTLTSAGLPTDDGVMDRSAVKLLCAAIRT